MRGTGLSGSVFLTRGPKPPRNPRLRAPGYRASLTEVSPLRPWERELKPACVVLGTGMHLQAGQERAHWASGRRGLPASPSALRLAGRASLPLPTAPTPPGGTDSAHPADLLARPRPGAA